MKVFYTTILIQSFILLNWDISIAQKVGDTTFIDRIYTKSEVETDSAYVALSFAVKEKKIDALSINERIAAIGKLLLDKPYIEKSLEVTNDESMTVCNLLGFDCVTFFETSWAFASAVKKFDRPTFAQFIEQVTDHRYRNGIRNGFQSRLHYTSDYFFDNAKRGNLQEMTKIIGDKDAKLETKPINFMTKHSNLYAQLANDPAMVAKMDSIEKMIAARGGFYFIPKEDVEDIEKEIRSGDLIGITTTVPGIDCSHTGIAIRLKDGKLHFMHASSAMHKVIISEKTLHEYLEDNKKQTGIMIYRPVESK